MKTCSFKREIQHIFTLNQIVIWSLLIVFPSSLKAQIIRTVAGNGTITFSGDSGLAINASLNGPTGIAVDSLGNLYIADNNNHRIRKVDATTKIISTIAGKDSIGYSGDGNLAINAKLNTPGNICIDKDGSIIFTDFGNNALRRIDLSTGIITTIAGGGAIYSDGVLAINSKLFQPYGVLIDSLRNIYISEAYVIRKINFATGIITTFKDLSHYRPPLRGISMDISGNIYVAVPNSLRIIKVTPAGVDSIFAGTGTCCYSGGTVAINTRFNYPSGVSIDNNGDLFVSDTYNGGIRKIDMKTRKVYDYVNTGSGGIFSGDEGPAILAKLNVPLTVVFDKINDMYIADYSNNRIRYVCQPGIDVPKADTINFCIKDSVPSPLYPGVGLKWYNYPTGDTGSNSEPIITTDTPAKLYYFVSQTGAIGCESIRTKLFINIYDFPVKPIITKSGMLLDVPNTYSSFQWYLNNAPILGATSNSYSMISDGKYHVKVTNDGGCEAFSDTLNYDAASIKNLFANNNIIKFYPNPTKKKLQIVSESLVCYQLKSITGILILQEAKSSKNHEIDLSHLTDGLYILTFIDTNGLIICNEKISKISF